MKLRDVCLFALLFPATLPAADPRFSDRDPLYRIEPSDVVEIQYRYTPEFNQSAVMVRPDGYVSLELIGEIKVAGLTVDEARSHIADLARNRLRDPEVTVVLKEFQRPYFMAAGEVANPGKYDLKGRVSTLEAITLAGGLRNSAKHSQVLLVHRVGQDLGETHVVDLKQIVRSRRFGEDVLVAPGDLIFVPQNQVSKIERFVKWGSFGMYMNPAMR